LDGGEAGAPAMLGQGELELGLDAEERRFIELSAPSIVQVDDAASSIAWDVAFQGLDIFLNGGISGPGSSKAFGPLSAPTFLSDTAPDVPVMMQDRAGGALLDWYDYHGTRHQLLSRYHVYGLRDADRLYKLQILSYYGGRIGSTSAQYSIRYAQVSGAGLGETVELSGIDASAGEEATDLDAPSACLDLDTQRIMLLEPEKARLSSDWQLCFRREAIAVNGGASGPRGILAVDLHDQETSAETEAELEQRSPSSELERFDAVDQDVLNDAALDWREDGIATAFGSRWLDENDGAPAPSDATWFLVGADGASKYLMRFLELSGDPERELSRLKLEIKSVR
jgi:hypothetical protein